ncbi:MAG: hypothetical protein ACLGPL_00055, partial [Acidobacteriota bacterium]
MDLGFKGKVGPQANQKIADLVRLPADFMVRSPFSVAQARLLWSKDGEKSFTGDLSVQNGPAVSLDVAKMPDSIAIKKLVIKDDVSDASLSLDIRKKQFGLDFKGSLSNRSLDRLLVRNQLLTGGIKGDFKSIIAMDRPMCSTANGTLKISGLEYGFGLDAPVRIDNAILLARGNRLSVKSASVNWQNNPLTLSGIIDFSEEAFQLNMDVVAESLDWEKLKFSKKDKPDAPQKENGKASGESDHDRGKSASAKPSRATLVQAVGTCAPGAEEQPLRPSFLGIPLRGTLQVKAASFTMKDYTWKPMNAVVSFRPDDVDIELKNAVLCGLATPGTINISEKGVRLDLAPAGLNGNLEYLLTCLNKKDLVDGTFNFSGTLIAGPAPAEHLVESLRGEFDFTAKKGRIFRFDMLSKIFALLNFTEIYHGQLPDLMSKGCAYDTIKASG